MELRRKKTSTAWWSGPDGAIVFCHRRAGARVSPGSRIAKPRWWWRPTKAKPRGCWKAPDGLVAATGDMGKLFRLAGCGGRERKLRIAGARFRLRGALGPDLLAQRNRQSAVPDAIGKFGASG